MLSRLMKMWVIRDCSGTDPPFASVTAKGTISSPYFSGKYATSPTHCGSLRIGSRELGSAPWATIQTKKLHAVELHLIGPKNKFALGRVTDFGVEPALDKDRPDRDIVRLQFNDPDQIVEESLSDFLREHAAATLEK